MEQLTLDRARSIVEGAESAFAGNGRFASTFEPFASAGARNRAEAVLALYLVIAEYLPVAVRNGEDSLQQFYKYANASGGMALKLIYEDNSYQDQNDKLGERETISSFVEFLLTIEQDTDNYWNNVYKRLGISPTRTSAVADFDRPPSEEIDNNKLRSTHSNKKQSWIKRFFGKKTTAITAYDKLHDKGSSLIVNSYRAFAKKSGCAPTSKTSDTQIFDIYTKIGTDFRQVATERQEHLSADSINFIVFKFIQISENFDQDIFNQHLSYELNKYRTEGLRPDYERGLEIF